MRGLTALRQFTSSARTSRYTLSRPAKSPGPDPDGGVAIRRVTGTKDVTADGAVDPVLVRLADMKIQPAVDAARKTMRTPAGDLPVVPLMDPAFVAARNRFVEPKAQVDVSKHGKLEKRLARNPYAWALAGPLRLDPTNEALLPRFFLQDFQYVPHPTTKVAWFVPSSLMPMPPESAHPMPDSATDIGEEGEVETPKLSPWVDLDVEEDNGIPDDTFSSSGREEEEPHNAKSHTRPRSVPRPHSKTSYTLCRHDLLSALAQRKQSRGQKKNASSSEAPREVNMFYAGKKGQLASLAGQEGRAVFREDMADFVLGLMRARTTDQLQHYGRLCAVPDRPRKYLIRCEGRWDEVTGEDASYRGCVLWIGDGGEEGPREFETVRFGEVKLDDAVPVHDLTVLLGEENVTRLRRDGGVFREGRTFILGRKKSTRLQLKLWKLQGYLAKYEELRMCM